MNPLICLLAILLAILLAGCTSHTDAERALDSMGFTQVQITGYRWFGCADSDDLHTGFRALGVNGKPVTGVVCSSFFWGKGTTVRFD